MFWCYCCCCCLHLFVLCCYICCFAFLFLPFFLFFFLSYQDLYENLLHCKYSISVDKENCIYLSRYFYKMLSTQNHCKCGTERDKGRTSTCKHQYMHTHTPTGQRELFVAARPSCVPWSATKPTPPRTFYWSWLWLLSDLLFCLRLTLYDLLFQWCGRKRTHKVFGTCTAKL